MQRLVLTATDGRQELDRLMNWLVGFLLVLSAAALVFVQTNPPI